MYFSLEEGILETTDVDCIITSTQRRNIEILTLATITVMMLASILHRAKKAGHIKDEINPVMLSKHIEIFYDTICVNPHILSTSKAAFVGNCTSILTLFLHFVIRKLFRSALI